MVEWSGGYQVLFYDPYKINKSHLGEFNAHFITLLTRSDYLQIFWHLHVSKNLVKTFMHSLTSCKSKRGSKKEFL